MMRNQLLDPENTPSKINTNEHTQNPNHGNGFDNDPWFNTSPTNSPNTMNSNMNNNMNNNYNTIEELH